MPAIKKVKDYRYWVRMDASESDRVLSDAIDRWAVEVGLDYPSQFIRNVLRRHALQEAIRAGVATDEDKKRFAKPLTK